jgi:hypothetical protein
LGTENRLLINNIPAFGGVALRQREVAVTSDPAAYKTYSACLQLPLQAVADCVRIF